MEREAKNFAERDGLCYLKERTVVRANEQRKSLPVRTPGEERRGKISLTQARLVIGAADLKKPAGKVSSSPQEVRATREIATKEVKS